MSPVIAPAADRPATGRAGGVPSVEQLTVHLAAAWAAVAPLYLLGAGWCPEPLVAFLAATTVGLGAATLAAPPATRSAAPAPVTRAGTVNGPPQPNQRHLAPPSADAHDAAPARETRPAAPPAVRRPVVPDGFEPATNAEMQCAWCGGFAFTPDPPPTCRTCGTVADPDERPDVAVRSWLHLNGG